MKTIIRTSCSPDSRIFSQQFIGSWLRSWTGSWAGAWSWSWIGLWHENRSWSWDLNQPLSEIWGKNITLSCYIEIYENHH